MPRRLPPGRLATALLGCALAAAASLTLPFAPLFDPWGWLVWGREIGALDLDTGAGPSWKPLTALICALVAPAGEEAAPDIWLLVARTAWLAVPVLAWTLAWRLEGSGGRRAVLAGGLAAAGVVLAHDAYTSPVRQFTGGLSEPLLAALVLGAVLAALQRRTRPALALALAACLLRPEAWPFAAVYAWREWREGRAGALVVLGGGAAVVTLWAVPDLLASGDALEGAARAREGTGAPAVEFLEVLGRAAAMPLALLWLGALAGLAGPVARRWDPAAWPGPARVLTVGALAWIGVVALMAAAGYAGLPRFMAPAIAVVCAVGAAVLAAIPRPRLLAVALVAVVLAADAGWRAADIPGEVARARDDAASLDRLRGLADDRATELRDCPPIHITDFLGQTAFAWELDVPVSRIAYATSYPREGGLVVGPDAAPGVATLAGLEAEPLGRRGEWAAYRAGPCEPGQPASGASIAGVSGARR